jgi:hypothetical protein
VRKGSATLGIGEQPIAAKANPDSAAYSTDPVIINMPAAAFTADTNLRAIAKVSAGECAFNTDHEKGSQLKIESGLAAAKETVVVEKVGRIRFVKLKEARIAPAIAAVGTNVETGPAARLFDGGGLNGFGILRFNAFRAGKKIVMNCKSQPEREGKSEPFHGVRYSTRRALCQCNTGPYILGRYAGDIESAVNGGTDGV